MSNFIGRTITSGFSIKRGAPTGLSFSTALLVLEDQGFSTVKTYLSLGQVENDFLKTSFAYKFCETYFSQKNSLGQIPSKILIVGNYENDYITTLDDVINTQNTSFYMVAIESRMKANVVSVASWVNTKTKLFVAFSQDVDIVDTNSTNDLLSTLKSTNAGVGNDRVCVFVGRKPVKTTISTSPHPYVSGDVYILNLLLHDAENSYNLKFEQEFVTDEATTLNALKTKMLASLVLKNNAEICPFSNITITTNTMTFTGIDDLLIGVIASFVKNGATYTNVVTTITPRGILGRIPEFGDAVVLGNRASRKSGETSIAYDQAFNYVQDVFTTDELNTIDQKNGNYLILGQGQVSTYQGKMTSGIYFDEMQVVDEIDQRLKEVLEDLFQTNVGTRTQPRFDKVGLERIEAIIRNKILEYAYAIDVESIVVNVKTPSEVTQNEKITRALDGTTYDYDLLGFIHKIHVFGEIGR